MSYKEARRMHAERLAEMRRTGGKLIQDYYDPSEPPMCPPSRGRVRRSKFMTGDAEARREANISAVFGLHPTRPTMILGDDIVALAEAIAREHDAKGTK